MTGYIIRRLLYAVPTLILISIISFIIIQAPPGDFLTTRLDVLKEQYGNVSQNEIEQLRSRYGLDRPLHEQYFRWISAIIVRGDFGQGFVQNRPVSEILAESVPLTVAITLVSLVFVWVTSIVIGVVSAVRQHRAFDYVFTFISFLGRSIPAFLMALVCMVVLYDLFGWSLGGLFSEKYASAPWSWEKLVDLVQHLILPIVVIGAGGTSSLVRVMRGMTLDELGKQYVQTARAKGLSERNVIWKHVFRIAVLPLVSTVGWLLPQLISGSMIVSIVMNLPTVGTYMYNALLDQDMYVSGAIVLVTSLFTVVGTLVSDICLAILDPRIRLGGSEISK